MTVTGSVENGRYRPWHEPTLKQKISGRYKKPVMTLYDDLRVAIENPAGSLRIGSSPNGEEWQTRMVYPYGFIVGSTGVDGDEVDCYIGPNPEASMVYVVHQRQAGDWDSYDEDKCMICFDSQEDAERAYLLHYDDDRFLGPVTTLTVERFKEKVLSTKEQPAMIKSIVDISAKSCGCANHTLEVMSKAISEDSHDIWAPHENPFISDLIEKFTAKGLARSRMVQNELSQWIAGKRLSEVTRSVERPGMMPYWQQDEMDLVRIYLENVRPEAYTLEDWEYLVQYLVQRYLPAEDMMTDAEWLVSKSFLMGKAQAHMLHIAPQNALTLAGSLPSTIGMIGVVVKLSDIDRQILQYAKLRACDSVVALSESARHGIKKVVVDHMAKVAQGDELATTGQLQQQLFDQFASLNRDWRRIATTESGEIANQAVISSINVGSKVKRQEMYSGACNFCKKLDGRVFNVVAADDPNKNGETDVWPGKTNIGRSASPRKKTENGLELREPHEMWWAAAGVQHPHCRGRWILMQEVQNDDFADWFRNKFGIEQGLKLSQWSGVVS